VFQKQSPATQTVYPGTVWQWMDDTSAFDGGAFNSHHRHYVFNLVSAIKMYCGMGGQESGRATVGEVGRDLCVPMIP
jgi:hypothetical protein